MKAYIGDFCCFKNRSLAQDSLMSLLHIVFSKSSGCEFSIYSCTRTCTTSKYWFPSCIINLLLTKLAQAEG